MQLMQDTSNIGMGLSLWSIVLQYIREALQRPAALWHHQAGAVGGQETPLTLLWSLRSLPDCPWSQWPVPQHTFTVGLASDPTQGRTALQGTCFRDHVPSKALRAVCQHHVFSSLRRVNHTHLVPSLLFGVTLEAAVQFFFLESIQLGRDELPTLNIILLHASLSHYNHSPWMTPTRQTPNFWPGSRNGTVWPVNETQRALPPTVVPMNLSRPAP